MQNLTTLSEAGDIIKQLQDLQKEIKEIREMLPPKQINDGWSHGVLCTSPSGEPPDPTTRIPGTSWAEEMDLRDPIEVSDDGDETSTATHDSWYF